MSSRTRARMKSATAPVSRSMLLPALPVELEACAASIEHPSAALESPAAALESPAAALESPAAALESPAAALESWSRTLPLRDLLAEHGSNVWIISESQLRANLAAWTRLAGTAARILYPVKANPSPAILEILASAGASAECASPAEILLARLAGFNDDRIAYNSPAADLATAWKLLASGGTVVADSRVFLAALDERAAAADRIGETLPRGRLLVRVNPSIDIRYRKAESWSDLTSHAKKSGKFGIPSEEIVDAVSRLVHLKVDGLHAHVGTQMDHVEPFVLLAAHLAQLARAIAARTGVLPTILDLGGGLGIPFAEKD
ncbi:MAG: diaminopimelate decarboxylase family protein, partial [bacterium]